MQYEWIKTIASFSMYAHENLDVEHDYSTYTVCIVWTGYLLFTILIW